jgi:hypothetical protein
MMVLRVLIVSSQDALSGQHPDGFTHGEIFGLESVSDELAFECAILLQLEEPEAGGHHHGTGARLSNELPSALELDR